MNTILGVRGGTVEAHQIWCAKTTRHKTYSYSPWAVITFSHTRDASWRLSRFVTYERMTPMGVYRV